MSYTELIKEHIIPFVQKEGFYLEIRGEFPSPSSPYDFFNKYGGHHCLLWNKSGFSIEIPIFHNELEHNLATKKIMLYIDRLKKTKSIGKLIYVAEFWIGDYKLQRKQQFIELPQPLSITLPLVDITFSFAGETENLAELNPTYQKLIFELDSTDRVEFNILYCKYILRKIK